MEEDNKIKNELEDVNSPFISAEDNGVNEGVMEKSFGESIVKNTFISVGGEKYAVGLFWQPLQDPDDPVNEIEETAEILSDGADLYCIRDGAAPQYALGIAGDVRPGMKVATSAVADAFSDKPSSVAVFKVEEGWWFLALRSDLILAEDDKLFTNEEDAKRAFFEMMAVPDWGRKIAPPEWNIQGTTYIELEDILKRSSFLKLIKIGSRKNIRKLWILSVMVVVLVFGLYKLIDSLTEPPPPVLKPIPKVVKKAPAPVVAPKVEAAPPPPPPWTNLNNPIDVLSKCNKEIKKLESIAIPGWSKNIITCNVSEKSGGVVSDWQRGDGRIFWFSDALNKLDLEKDYKLSITDSGDRGKITANFKDVKKIDSPPVLSGKDIRLQLLEIFDAIGIKITFGSATEGEIKDPNNPNAPPRPRYFLVKFKFTTEYQPDTWMDVLSQFQALTINDIEYNTEKKTWSYEGKIYERRI